MRLALDLAIGLAVGAVGGLAFFGGLRWTVRRLPSARRPALLAVASFLLRGLALTGLLVAAGAGSPMRIAAGLGGVLAVRTVMVRGVRRELERAGEAPWT